MALIKCAECGGQVSSQAFACPHCGAPVPDDQGAAKSLTTIQETSKRLKVHILFSALLFWGGIIVAFGQSADPTASFNPGPLMITIGLFWYIITKARVWWHHK
jgi:hypothetical protein